jgi:hypothetical protein
VVFVGFLTVLISDVSGHGVLLGFDWLLHRLNQAYQEAVSDPVTTYK